MTTYDHIGTGYDDTRRADARITTALLAALDLPPTSTLVDVGAGTGNYSVALAQAGFRVYAVEPSRTMRQQGKQHPRVMWHAAQAEALPFADASIDGVLSTLAVHHFADLKKSFAEMARVLRKDEHVTHLARSRTRSLIRIPFTLGPMLLISIPFTLSQGLLIHIPFILGQGFLFRNTRNRSIQYRTEARQLVDWRFFSLLTAELLLFNLYIGISNGWNPL